MRIIAAMPTALVTGGAGFLGSHLCDHLLARDFRVICVDNLDTASLRNIEHIRDDKFAFVNHDMMEHLEVDEPVDFVFHFAALASPIDYMRMPLHSLKVGSYGTHNALGLAKFKRALPARLHERGLRRSGGAPAEGDVLGERQPDRAARSTTRRSATPRR